MVRMEQVGKNGTSWFVWSKMVKIMFLAEEEEEPFRGVRENVVSQFL